MVDTVPDKPSSTLPHRLPPDPGEAAWSTVLPRRRRQQSVASKVSPPLSTTRGDRSRPLRPLSRQIHAAQCFPVHPLAQKRSWSDIVTLGGHSNTNRELEFYKPAQSESVTILAEDCAVSAETWRNSLVLYVAGPRPYYIRLKELLTKLWKPAKFELLARENGFFIASMESDEECARILSSGPWMVDGLLLIVRRWTTSFIFEKDLFASIPIWIRLPELPLLVWNSKAISKIASLVGRPIKLDDPTADHTRISFARVLVEVNCSQKLISKISVQIEGSSSFDQSIIYERLPPKCNKCKVFGHSDAICPINLKSTWVRKDGLDGYEADLAYCKEPSIAVKNAAVPVDVVDLEGLNKLSELNVVENAWGNARLSGVEEEPGWLNGSGSAVSKMVSSSGGKVGGGGGCSVSTAPSGSSPPAGTDLIHGSAAWSRDHPPLCSPRNSNVANFSQPSPASWAKVVSRDTGNSVISAGAHVMSSSVPPAGVSVPLPNLKNHKLDTPFPKVASLMGVDSTKDDSVYWSNVQTYGRGPPYTSFSEDEDWDSSGSIDDYEDRARYISKNKKWMDRYSGLIEKKIEKSKSKGKRTENVSKSGYNTRSRSQHL